MAVVERPLPLRVEPELEEPRIGVAPRRWRWTGDDLIRMGELGLLPPEGRFELLDGEIYEVMPPGPYHSATTDVLGDLLDSVFKDHGAFAREEKPIRLNEHYNPEPDVAVVRGRHGDYRERFPRSDEVLLVVEIAHSSLEYDRLLKLPGYAGAGIPECWIVNVPELQVEVHSEPEGGKYRSVTIYRPGDSVPIPGVPDAALPVAYFLEPPSSAQAE
jgi:Uma2 family endonuclease